MRNQERAAEVIKEAFDKAMSSSTRSTWAHQIAQALNDAGQLMPDPPEPEMKDGRKVWRVDEEGFVYIKPNGWIATVAVSNPYDSPAIAHRHALAIIAAANHAEQEQAMSKTLANMTPEEQQKCAEVCNHGN